MKATILAVLLVSSGGIHAAEQILDPGLQPSVAKTYGHVLLGTTDAEDAWSLDDPSTGVRLESDYSSLPLVGGIGQRLWGATAQYGFEGGSLLSFKNDSVVFAGADPGLNVSIDNELFFADVFMGGVVSLRPARWVRLYAAAGPSIAWGFLNGDKDDGDNGEDTVVVVGPGSILVIDLDESHSDYSFALYGRVGIDFELDSGFTFGISARYAKHEMDFDERGEFTLDAMQWFITLGGRF